MPEGTGEAGAEPAVRQPGGDDEEPVGPGDGQPGSPLQRQATSEPRVDEALARLDDLPKLPVTEHREVFEHVHRRLREVLGELDPGPADTA
jgi:hypothetical protein